MHKIIIYFALLGVGSIANLSLCDLIKISSDYEDAWRILMVEQIYDEVNEHLEGKEKGPIDDLELALDYSRPKAAGDEHYSRAIRYLEALKWLNNDWSCDRNARAIALVNNEATNNSTYKPNPHPEELRRIDQIVDRTTRSHAYRCRALYPTYLNLKYDKLDKKLVESVEALTNGHINRKINVEAAKQAWIAPDAEALRTIFERMDESEFKFYLNIKSFNNIIDLRDALVYFVNTKENKLVTRDNVNMLFNSHILKPCRYYTDELGADVFEPALYESAMLTDPFGKKFVLQQFNYYLAQANYQLCSLIQSDQEFLLENLEKIIDGAKADSDNVGSRKIPSDS